MLLTVEPTIKILIFLFSSREYRAIKFIMQQGLLQKEWFGFFNAGTQVLNAWTPTNTNTNIPRAISSDPNQNARPLPVFLKMVLTCV